MLVVYLNNDLGPDMRTLRLQCECRFGAYDKYFCIAMGRLNVSARYQYSIKGFHGWVYFNGLEVTTTATGWPESQDPTYV